MDSDRGDAGTSRALEKLSSKLLQFLGEARAVKSSQYLLALAQLCYCDTTVAYGVWVELFPRIWAVLSDWQRKVCGAHPMCDTENGFDTIRAISMQLQISPTWLVR